METSLFIEMIELIQVERYRIASVSRQYKAHHRPIISTSQRKTLKLRQLKLDSPAPKAQNFA